MAEWWCSIRCTQYIARHGITRTLSKIITESNFNLIFVGGFRAKFRGCGTKLTAQMDANGGHNCNFTGPCGSMQRIRVSLGHCQGSNPWAFAQGILGCEKVLMGEVCRDWWILINFLRQWSHVKYASICFQNLWSIYRTHPPENAGPPPTPKHFLAESCRGKARVVDSHAWCWCLIFENICCNDHSTQSMHHGGTPSMPLWKCASCIVASCV